MNILIEVAILQQSIKVVPIKRVELDFEYERLSLSREDEVRYETPQLWLSVVY